ncbi:MAG: hypothetical protein QM793_14845 [Muricomes sp.]
MSAVDKYEYKLKTEQMLELMESGAYNKAAEVADSIDWKRVRNAAMLMNVSDIYEKNEEYQKSYEVLNIAYHRAEGSRKVLYRLCALALKTGNVDEAIDYYDDFIEVAPKDPNQHILKYKILRARRAPIEQQIEALEEFKKAEYIEEWAFELAKLYQEAGMTAECLEECDDLILWFSEGKYVYKAMELKMQYKQLTPSQQEKYDRRYEKIEEPRAAVRKVEEPKAESAVIEGATEEIPDLTQYKERLEAIAEANTKPDRRELEEDYEEDEEKLYEDAPEELESEEPLPEGDAEEFESIEDDETVQKLTRKGIGSTMKLEEALQTLLNPKDTAPEDTETPDIEVDEEETVSGLETAIEEIESVIDLDLVNELAGKNDKDVPIDADLEELKPEPIEEQAEVSEEAVQEKSEDAAGETAKDTEELENNNSDTDVENNESDGAEDLLAVKNINSEHKKPEDSDQIEGQLSIEDILMGWNTEDSPADEVKMEEKEKEAEPILPPDIQRMIDEIEGVLPEEPAPTPAPVEKVEEPQENKGKITEQLRIDEIEAFLEDEDVEDFEEDIIEEDDEVADDSYDEVYDELEDDSYDDEYDEIEDDSYEEEYDEIEDDSYEEEYDEVDDDSYDEEYEELEDDSYEEEYDEIDDDSYEEEYDEIEDDSYEEEYDEIEDDSYEEEYDEIEDDSYEEEYDEIEEDSYEEEYEDIGANFEEEFRVNPEHAGVLDEREIPDDEDDVMDIMSATTPLSRKETAKLIATGKTAPLPLDDISNALSMSNTGFVVHGRYDLETQSGIGLRAGLTEEQKKLFSYFVPVRGMSEQLVDVLEQDRNCTNREGTSRTGNLLIIGNKGSGKTVLAVDIVKAIQKQRNIRQGKVAIVTGESLNKKKIGDIVAKLHGGALIIEKAGKMNEKTVARLNKAMERDTGEMFIVLEEQRKPLDRLLSSNREFRRKFTSRLEVPIFINDELVTFGQTYAQENGYRIDEMGILALYSRIDALQREDHAVTVAEVKEVMDEAIEHSQKASAKKLVKRVFGRNTDDADRIILTEKDFNI